MKILLPILALASALAHAQDRPQLFEAEAAKYTVATYLAQGPAPWQLGPLASGKPHFIVAQDGSGTHRSVQAALDAVPASGPRQLIEIRPGVYREQVCVRGKAPMTIYGGGSAPEAVVIVAGHYSGEAKPAGSPANPCAPNLSAGNYGTAGSASVALFSDDVQLSRLTIANDAMDGVRLDQGYPPMASNSGGAQAVALMTEGDRIQLQGVRLIGHQDTFYVRGAGRVHVRESFINGDVDFIFGSAALVIEHSTIESRAGRRAAGQGGPVLAPSTAPERVLGFLVINSRFTAEPGLNPGAAAIGRAWDAGVPHGTYKPGVSPNGQALVRDSEIGPHIGPWAASTSRRPFSASGEQANRLSEYRNTAEISRQTLGPRDGWAAAEGGTQGGALARPEHVFTVSNRAELVAALALGHTPKIIRVRGRIDVNVDDAGRPLAYEDYRDKAFDFEAYLKAYDPTTWGKQPLTGPLEEARIRSARAQAARIQIRMPSNTTLIGVGPDAGIKNGGLFLDKVDNIIIRNLHFADAYDFFPAWDPKDNAAGEWNSEYDAVTLRGATHVWVDHCTFDDGARLDQTARVALGRKMQHHDGLLDITNQSNFVTVSWNHFRNHDKTNLVGSSDGQKLDAGKLKATFHHNLWQDVKERAPRVRYGEVHVYNNLYIGRSDADYAYAYSIGVGIDSRIYSERNVWELGADVRPGQLLRLLKGAAFFDSGSLLNGAPVDLLGALRAANPAASLSADVGWQPGLVENMDAAESVAAKVRSGAGAGRIY